MNDNIESKKLLQKLADCADECNRCYNACLENERTEELLRALRLCRDCSRICRTASDFVSSESELADEILKACAKACRLCAESCSNHEEHEQECKPCAEICRECEEACNTYTGVSA